MRRLILLFIILALAGCGTPKPGAEGGHSGHEHSESEGHESQEPGDLGAEEHGKEKEGHSDHDDQAKEEGFVVPSEAQKKEIGLSLAATEPVQGSESGVRTGRVESDPDRRVVVSPQVSGSVRDLPVIVGSRVRRGDMVAVLESPEVTQLKGDYHNAEVEADLAAKELSNTRQLIAVGDESRRGVEEAKLEMAKATASRDGVAARLESAVLTHQRLQKLRDEGIASSQQVEEASAVRKALEADLLEAKTSLAIAGQHLQREKGVAGSRLREKAETFPAEASLARAQESIKHLEERLIQLGANPHEDEGTIILTSPIDGEVVERPVTRGQVVSPGEPIAVLVDSSEVWVLVDMLRSDLATVSVGDEVTVSLVSDPKVRAAGQLSYIDPQVNSESQTVKGRVALRESAGKFRVGSFVNALIRGRASGQASVSLPSEALQDVEGQTVVYLPDGLGYRRTPVVVIGTLGEQSTVTGLPPESKIVVKGASDLKALDLAATIGGHQH